MKRWNSLYDQVRVPLELILIVTIIKTISGLVLSPNFQVYWDIAGTLYASLAQILLNFSSLFLEAAPLIIGLHLLYKQHQHSLPALMLLALVVLNNSFAEVFVYKSSPLASLIIPSNPFGAGTLQVLFLGIFVHYLYKLSLNRSRYSFMSFLSQNVWFIVNSLVLGFFLIGLWILTIPYLLSFSEFVYKLIAYDINNPVSLFFYGLLERLYTLLNVPNLIRQPFLFNAAGGAWIDAVGNNYLGDITIWTAQIAQNVFTGGVGRFITPNYLVTLFIIPAILISIWEKTRDKIERNKSLILVLVLIVLSTFGNTLLPYELFLLFLAPALLIFHYLYLALLYAILPILNVYIGTASTTSGLVAVGNIFDLYVYLKLPVIRQMLGALIGLGIISFIIYYVVFTFYYQQLALDFFQAGRQTQIIQDFIEACGGLSNIKVLTNTPFSLRLSFYDPNLVEFQQLRSLGIFQIKETRYGYIFLLGSGSFALAQQVNRKLKNRIT